MSSPPLGTYATSSALSTTHYKLVSAVEAAPDAEAVNGILVDACRRIQDTWSRKAPTPSRASHDVILLLYCRSQRRDAPLAREEAALLDGRWALPSAVLLAGGGRLREREIGYRACVELLPSTPHPLKLLLINTLLRDLSVPPSTNDAEKQRSMALRATSSSNVVTPELIPAVHEHVCDLLATSSVAESVKRLALTALLSLVEHAHEFGLDSAPALIAESRAQVLALLLPPPPSSASTSSRHRHSRHSPPSVAFLAALSSAIAPSSPVHPVLPDANERLQLHATLLNRMLDDTEAEDARASSTKRIWAIECMLRNVGAEVEKLERKNLGAADHLQELIGRTIRWLLSIDTALTDGALVSALHLLPLLPDALPTESTTFDSLLSRIQARLLHPQSPSQLLFTLRSLALIPPSRWTAASPGETQARRAPWGQQEWTALLATLNSLDSTIRLAGLALIWRVDLNLVKLHYERLIASLAEDHASESATNLSSGGGGSRKGWAKQRDQVVGRLLELLPFLPHDTIDSSSTTPLLALPPRLPPVPALLALLSRSELDIAPTLPLSSLVLPVLSSFHHAAPGQQVHFARQLVFDAEERWKKTLVAGLWVAGTAHVLRDDEAERATERAIHWLASASADPALVEPLQEPLLFLVLRLVALNPSQPYSRLANAISSAGKPFALPDTQQLLPKLEAVLRDPTERQSLAEAGAATARSSLVDFSSRLFPTAPREQSYVDAPASSRPPSSHVPRVFHPPSISTTSPTPSSPLSTTNQVSSPRASRSARALERERADLLRERTDRGGRGSGSGMIESLMERASLADLRHDERGRNEASGNALGLQTSSGDEVSEPVAGEEHHHGGETSGEPPSDLIELQSLDPFRSD